MRTITRRCLPPPLGLALLLGVACTMGPDYERPDLTISQSYRTASPSASAEANPTSASDVEETESLEELAWWELFGDEVLTELVETALAESKDVRIAAARVEEARARFRAVRGAEMPQVGVDAGASRSQSSGQKSPGAEPVDDYELVGSVFWEIDLWGRLRRATEAARASLLASEEARNGVRLTLEAEVARAYFELRDLDKRLEITFSTVTSRRESLEIARLRFEGGLTSELEVRQAETELAAAEVLVPDLEQQRFEKENELSVLLGRDPGPIARGLDLTGEPLLPSIPAGLPSELLERRPDLRQTEQELIAANAEVGIAIASLYPRLSLSGAGGVASNELDELLDSGAGIWDLAANLAAPIFQGGRLRADVAASRARFEQAVLIYEQRVQQALREVADALSAVDTTDRALAAQGRLVLASQQYLELARLQYANGIKSYLDTLDAQRGLFSAQLGLSTTTRDRLLSVVDVYRTLGGGWAVP